MTEIESTRYLREIRNRMDEHFNLEEIRFLATDLGVDYEHLAGENSNKPRKIHSLIFHMGRNKRLHELIALIEEERPKVDWPQIPEDAEKIKGHVEELEPKVPKPDSALYAVLLTFQIILTCSFLGVMRNINGNTIIYFLCAPLFLLPAIFGFILGHQYESKRTKQLSVILAVSSIVATILSLVLPLMVGMMTNGFQNIR